MLIIKNYFYNALYQILRIILPVITMPYIARVLSANGVGAYSVSAAWANYFMIVGMLGIDSYGSRQIAYVRENKEKRRETFWEINGLKSISVFFSICIYSAVIYGILKPDNKVLYYIQTINLLSCFFDVSWYFAGIENFKNISIRNMAVKLVGTIGIFAFVRDTDDVWVYTLILCLGQLVGQLALWKAIYMDLFPLMIPNVNCMLFHLKKTVLLWVPSLAASVYNYLDKVMLGSFTDDFQVGLYEYSQNIVKVPATLIFAIATVTMPHAAADFANKNVDNAKNIFYKSMHIVSMFALPMCFGFMAISDNFVKWFLGDGYSDVSRLMKISTWVILPISWSQIVGSQLIIAKGREKVYSLSICYGAIVNAMLNYLVVGQYQARGVLVASIVAEMVVLFVMLFFSRNDFTFCRAFGGVMKYFFSATIMYLAIIKTYSFIETEPILMTIIQVMLGMVVYISVLLIMKEENVIFFINRAKDFLKNHNRKG